MFGLVQPGSYVPGTVCHGCFAVRNSATSNGWKVDYLLGIEVQTKTVLELVLVGYYSDLALPKVGELR